MNIHNELINGCGYVILPIENMNIFNKLRETFLDKMENSNDSKKNIDQLNEGG